MGGGSKNEVKFSAVDVACGPQYTMVVGQKNPEGESCVITCITEESDIFVMNDLKKILLKEGVLSDFFRGQGESREEAKNAVAEEFYVSKEAWVKYLMKRNNSLQKSKLE